eukprot:4632300-Pleurochrysis_carterae.AAC.3
MMHPYAQMQLQHTSVNLTAANREPWKHKLANSYLVIPLHNTTTSDKSVVFRHDSSVTSAKGTQTDTYAIRKSRTISNKPFRSAAVVTQYVPMVNMTDPSQGADGTAWLWLRRALLPPKGVAFAQILRKADNCVHRHQSSWACLLTLGNDNQGTRKPELPCDEFRCLVM